MEVKNKLSKITRAMAWIDASIKWVVRPYFYWLGLECFSILTVMLLELADDSFRHSLVFETRNTLSNVSTGFMISYLHYMTIFLQVLVILPLVPVLINIIWYLFKNRKKELADV